MMYSTFKEKKVFFFIVYKMKNIYNEKNLIIKFNLFLSFVALITLIVLSTIGGSVGRPLYDFRDQKPEQPLQTFRPFNIAHRGSNGELPEETAIAYMVTHFLLS